MTTLTAQRDADRRYTFSPSSGFTFADLTPLLKIWLGEGNSETPALTVTLTPTVNGSSFIPYSSSLVLTLDKADLAALPEGELFYDITLTDGTGFENALCGGSFELYEDGADGGCGGCEGGVLTFNTNGQCVTIVLQGGNLSVGASISLAALNAAVAAADASSDSAAASAAAAAASVAAVPALIAGKLDVNGGNAASNILTNLPYLQSGTSAVSRSQKSKNDDALNTKDFDVTADGTTDDTLAMAAAVVEHLASGRPLRVQPGVIKMTTGLNAIISTFTGAFGASINIRGSGIRRTFFDWLGSNDWFFELTSSTTLKFNVGGYLGDFSIISSTPGANASGVRLRSTVGFTAENIEITGLSGTGWDDACLDGDPDGNVQLTKRNIRIFNCAGWGWNGAASLGHNENSGLDSYHMFVQGCGSNEATAITGITQANPAVVTSAAHGRVNGDLVYLGGVQGMTQVNTSISEVAYVVAGATTNTFQLTGINSTGFGAYTSGGHVMSARPRSGNVKLKGQISRQDRFFSTLSKNVGLYVEQGPATAQGLDLSGCVIENFQYCGVIVAGITNLRMRQCQSYLNSAISGAQGLLGIVLDGTNTVVQNVDIKQHVVRATANDPDYCQYAIVGGNVATQTIKINDTVWDNFGYTRQKRFTSQFRFDATFSENVTPVAVGVNEAYVQPSSFGSKGAFIPVRLRFAVGGNSSDGEWATRFINQVSIPKPGADGVYNIYTYDASNVVTAEAVADVPVKDVVSGYTVKTGDATRLWHGRLEVSGGDWKLTQGGFLNPLRISGPQAGVPASLFFNEADRSINIKTLSTLPGSIGDFNFKFYPTFDAQATVDLPSIAAGASSTFTVTSGVTASLGDLVKAVSCSIDTAGLILDGRISAANTITDTAFNPTAAAIDLASATFYNRYERR